MVFFHDLIPVGMIDDLSVKAAFCVDAERVFVPETVDLFRIHPFHNFSGGGDQNQLRSAALVFHAGIGGEGGGEGDHLGFFQQMLGESIQCIADTQLQIFFCSEGFSLGENFFAVKIVDDCIGVGSARIDTDSQIHSFFLI